MAGKFTVLVDDYFHYKDESERYELGEFEDLATAVAACRRIADDYLNGAIEGVPRQSPMRTCSVSRAWV